MLEEFLGSEIVEAATFAALFTILFMLVVLKGAIHLAFEAWYKKQGLECPEDLPFRSLVINVVTLALATVIVLFRYDFDVLTTLLAGGLSAAFVIGGYEPLKNILGAIGFDLEKINVLHYIG